MSEREQFEAWWNTAGRSLCGCSLVPDHSSPNQVYAARGFGAGFAAGFEAARAQPAQAGQVLTDDEILDLAETHGLDTFVYEHFARAIEQSVLAKRVPMTREEVKDLARKVGYDNATAQERVDFINGIRHAEVWHGIGGEKEER